MTKWLTARRDHRDALLARPFPYCARDRPAKLKAALRCRLIGRIIGVDQDGAERRRPALENPPIDEAVGMSELARHPAVVRLLAQRGGVELVSDRARDEVRRELCRAG